MNGRTNARTREAISPASAAQRWEAFDLLPREVRRWLMGAVLPWCPVSLGGRLLEHARQIGPRRAEAALLAELRAFEAEEIAAFGRASWGDCSPHQAAAASVLRPSPSPRWG